MRIDKAYNPLADQLKYIEDQILDLKKRQINGTDTIITYKNLSTAGKTDGWDLDFTTTSSFTYVEKSIVFTADTIPAPINNLRYYILVDGVEFTTGFPDKPFQNKVAVAAFVRDSFLTYAGLIPTPKKDGWYFAIRVNATGVNVKVRFIVDSTDTGTILVQNVST